MRDGLRSNRVLLAVLAAGLAMAALRAGAVDQPSAPVPRDPAIDAAWALAREGKGDEALARIRAAAEGHADWPPPRVILAKMFLSSGQVERGRLALEEAAEETPDDPVVALTFAAVDMAEGRRHDARLNAERALATADRKPDDASRKDVTHEAHKVLSAIAEARAQWEAAESHLRAMLALRPREGATHQALGRVLFRQGHHDQAYSEFQQAEKADPAVEPAEVSMALLSQSSGDSEKAAVWFERAKAARPESARPRVAQALWLMDRGRLDAAKAAADEAARLEPDAETSRRVQALVAFHSRDLASAEARYEELYRKHPDEAGIANLLALTLVDQDDKAKRARGLQIAEGLARKYPRSSEILGTLGHAHDQNGHPQDAEINLRAAVAGGKANPDTTYFLAKILADRGRTSEARALLQAATRAPGAFAYRMAAEKLLANLPPSPR